MQRSHTLPLTCQNQASRPRRRGLERQPTNKTTRHKRLSTLSLSSFHRPPMPSKFNIFRASLLGVALIWTIICLAISAHFQSLLVIDDLTRFVPFAIFVASISLFVLVVLLSFSLKRSGNPISTRIELGCLGLIGTFWLALGAFLASSDSDSADVECYASETSTDLIDIPGFSTEAYQAQYRVLEAFSLFNVILIWGFFFLLLGLALKHHFRVNRRVWLIGVTDYPWFGKGSSKQLPAPISNRSRSRGRAQYDEKNYTTPIWQYRSRHGNAEYTVWTAPQRQKVAAPSRAHTTDKYKRNASPRR